MKLLADTNVIIPLEPTSPADREALTERVTTLARLSAELGHPIYIHPASHLDVAKDTNRERNDLRHQLLHKYPSLPDPPNVEQHVGNILGVPPLNSNDWIDNQLIAALVADAVDFLITEDRKLQGKARRLGLGHRVVSVTEAVSLLSDLYERVPNTPPAVRVTKAHTIRSQDPILDSFRSDYPNFDSWLQRCKREHRLTWVIEGDNSNVAAFCIAKHEAQPPNGIRGKVLKVCSLKVSEAYNGLRYGELLLKAVFEYAFLNSYDFMFITAFEKHGTLVQLLEDFGFVRLISTTSLGEMMLIKSLKPDKMVSQLTPLEYHIKYGPWYFLTENIPWYAVPIQPQFADLLFPETAAQQRLFVGIHPFGNAIRKAYLCRSPIRCINPGSVLVFYQSGTATGAVAIGIVENTMVTSSSHQLVQFVGKRTVYSLSDIQQLCDRPVLALLFRQARVFSPIIEQSELIAGGVFKRPPQSIMQIGEKGKKWLQARLKV